ncbi:unnamed protein product [Adineta steineri]|uniref:ADP-ribosylglycohydrolase n=1 Tax=Adineta steineri TaxID=433720 RepID=A0A818KTK5_9BILA|nr:unnamed protein product [Adineta steineri]CAF3559436.1 unnamed protein product [Adineta steineri]
MVSIHARCNDVFIGHAIASHFDTSAQLAQELSESLLTLESFNGPDIMSRYLYLYHTKRCDFGETLKIVYQNLKDKITINESLPISRENCRFDQLIIDETVKMTDGKLGGHTAGCGPVHRSFPLALCSWIDDDDLFELSMKEAALTHYSSLAGQVSGIVNLICRSLIKNRPWRDAVQSAFTTPLLHKDVCSIYGRYNRWSDLGKQTHPAYAPAVLIEALHYIANSSNAIDAIEKATTKKNSYCLPIIGILASARWGFPLDTYNDKIKDGQLKIIRDTANKLSNQWSLQQHNIYA